jgi:hypothetical protein
MHKEISPATPAAILSGSPMANLASVEPRFRKMRSFHLSKEQRINVNHKYSCRTSCQTGVDFSGALAQQYLLLVG